MAPPPPDELQFSVIVPVYNRPEEARDLLGSLARQTDSGFDVLVVEDGSDDRCEEAVREYEGKLDVHYVYKENTGPGRTRNFGAERADGNYYVFFDSDCLVPPEYFETVRTALREDYAGAYGGPDRAHPSFSPVQKAINYAMTSFLTTGGIRGGKRRVESFKPRSFNMGVGAEAFNQVGGFPPMGIYGEDLDLSLRLQSAGISTRLIEDAFVYHKRRSGFKAFFGQVFQTGRVRLSLYQRHPSSLKPVHALPSVFTVGAAALLTGAASGRLLLLVPLVFGLAVLFADAWRLTRSVKVAGLAVVASLVQLTGYGLGFLRGLGDLLGDRQ